MVYFARLPCTTPYKGRSMDVLAKFQGEIDEIPWVAGLRYSNVDFNLVLRHIQEFLHEENWNLCCAANYMAFSMTPPQFEYDETYSFAYIDENGNFQGNNTVAPIFFEIYKALRRVTFRCVAEGSWDFMGFKNYSDIRGDKTLDKQLLSYPLYAFYWWWRTGGMKSAFAAPVFPLVFRFITISKDINAFLLDLQKGLSDDELLHTYKGLITQKVLDALRRKEDGTGVSTDFFVYENATKEEIKTEEARPANMRNSAASSEGAAIDAHTGVLEQRLLLALKGMIDEEKARYIIEHLPEWLANRKDNDQYKPWFTAALLAIAEVSHLRLDEDKSPYRKQIDGIAQKACSLAGVEGNNSDLAQIKKATRRYVSQGGRPRKEEETFIEEENLPF